MAINFPNTPSAGDPHTEGGVNWTYDGEKWVSQSTDEASLWTRDVATDTLSPTNSGDNVQIASLNGGPLAGFRNQLINGNFLINQRYPIGASQLNLTTWQYTADRWVIFNGDVGSYATTTVTQEHSTASLRVAGGNSLKQQLVTSGSNISYRQAIETEQYTPNAFTQGSTWTMSCYSTFVPTFTFMWSSNGVAPNPGQFTIIAQGQGVPLGGDRYSFTFTINTPMIAGCNSLVVDIANAAAPDSEKELAGCQLEPGSQPTPFEHRPIGVELGLCQRYYQTVYLYDSLWTSEAMNRTYFAPTTIRSGATITYQGAGRAPASFSYSGSSIQVNWETGVVGQAVAGDLIIDAEL